MLAVFAIFRPLTGTLNITITTAFPTRISCKISHKNFPQDFPTRFSRKIFPSWILIGWLPITLLQILNFHQSLPFLNCHFSPPPFPTRFSCKNFLQEFPTRFPATISRNNFLQDFPARFSQARSSLVGSPSPYSKC